MSRVIINEEIRKCVVFVAIRDNKGEFHTRGTAFFLGREVEGTNTTNPTYLVTAKHVINKAKETLVESIWLRHNLKEGDDAWLETKIENWETHGTNNSLDVAILKMGVLPEFDNLVIPYGLCANEQVFKENQIGLGDEVFITGLFSHHQGKKKNIPIVRTGNLACLNEEKINTKEHGEIDAYLVEARSIGGLSGSPVFVNLGVTRFMDGQLKKSEKGPIFYLIGLIHGHFDVDETEFESKAEGTSISKINSGIAIVVPFHSINETINDIEARTQIPKLS